MSKFKNNEINMGVALTSILSGQPYRGVYYSNLQMYGPDFSEEIDPECQVQSTAVSTYWPGGLPERKQHLFGTYIMEKLTPNEACKQIAQKRTNLLSLQLSKRAIRRWEDFNGNNGGRNSQTSDEMVSMACEISQVPYVSAVFSRVIRHRKIKTGQSVAHLYFPTMTKDPRFALAELQQAQKAAIDEEKL